MSRFQYGFMDRLKALPGVDSVGYVTTLPLDEGAGTQNITTPRLTASGTEAPVLRFAGAGGAYFQTMGIELKRGRHFERVEEEQGLPNVIISQSAADLLYPGEDPIGKQVRPAASSNPQWFTVIGVVEDILVDDLRRGTPEPMVYLPAVSGSPAYVIKSTRAEALEPEVRAIIREVLPNSPMYRIFTMERLAANAMANLSFTMLMVSMGAVLALVLGAVGLYGVLSYRVTRRTQEIGVRMALGAEATTVRRMFVWQGGRVALVGIAVGLLVAVALTTYVQTLLFNVGRFDPVAFAGTSAVMLVVALLASYLPALRASRVDPVVALRAE
jgi:putative ABC transport system permease protein